MKKFIIVFITFLAGIELSTQGAQPAVDWDGSQAVLFSDNDGPFAIGFQFRANSDISVTSLGAFDYLGDGFATAHTVGLWSNSGGAPLGVVTLPSGTGASLLGQFRYGDIAGVTLTAGAEYVILASDYYGSINDIYAHSVPFNALSFAPQVTFLNHRESFGSGLNFPPPQTGGLPTFGANFQFVTVPEPSTWALLGVGLVLFVFRRGFQCSRAA